MTITEIRIRPDLRKFELKKMEQSFFEWTYPRDQNQLFEWQNALLIFGRVDIFNLVICIFEIMQKTHLSETRFLPIFLLLDLTVANLRHQIKTSNKFCKTIIIHYYEQMKIRYLKYHGVPKYFRPIYKTRVKFAFWTSTYGAEIFYLQSK